MKRICLILSLAVAAFCESDTVMAQRVWQGFFTNTELNLRVQLNLYADSIDVPGLDMETCYGYLQGNINGTWVILRVKELTKTTALVRAVSERGSDGQDLEFELQGDDLYLRLKGDVELKGVKNGKYAKLPKPTVLERMGKH